MPNDPELKVSHLISAHPDPVFVKSIGGSFLHCNASFAEIVGVEIRKILGSRLIDIVKSEFSKACERSDKYLLARLSPTQTYTSPIHNRLTNEQFDVHLTKSICINEDGYPLGFMCIVRSVKKRVLGSAPAQLSARELDVLRLVAAGRTQKEISNDLSISIHTTAHHMKSIYLKLNVNNRVQAVSAARSFRLI